MYNNYHTNKVFLIWFDYCRWSQNPREVVYYVQASPRLYLSKLKFSNLEVSVINSRKENTANCPLKLVSYSPGWLGYNCWRNLRCSFKVFWQHSCSGPNLFLIVRWKLTISKPNHTCFQRSHLKCEFKRLKL